MSIVTMGIAGVKNVTLTMVNTTEEDNRLLQSEPKDLGAARFGMARKRLMSYGQKTLTKGVKGEETTIYTPHAAETVVFPISA